MIMSMSVPLGHVWL